MSKKIQVVIETGGLPKALIELLSAVREELKGDRALRDKVRQRLDIADDNLARRLTRLRRHLDFVGADWTLTARNSEIIVEDRSLLSEIANAQSRSPNTAVPKNTSTPFAQPDLRKLLVLLAANESRNEEDRSTQFVDNLRSTLAHGDFGERNFQTASLEILIARGALEYQKAIDANFDVRLVVAYISPSFATAPPAELEEFFTPSGAVTPGNAVYAVSDGVERTKAPLRFRFADCLWIAVPEGNPAALARIAARRLSENLRLDQRLTRYFDDAPARPDFLGIRTYADPRASRDDLHRRCPDIMIEALVGAEAPLPEAPERRATTNVDLVQYVRDWLVGNAGTRMIALLGDYGMGKTTASRLIARRIAEERKAGAVVPPALYFDLRDVANAPSGDQDYLGHIVKSALHAMPELSRYEPADIVRHIRDSDALVIFDGLDEVTNRMSVPHAQTLYRAILSVVTDEHWRNESAGDREPGARPRGRPRKAPAKRRGPRLLVTCRTHYFATLRDQHRYLRDSDRTNLPLDDALELWFVLPLSHEQIEIYIDQNFPENREAIKQLIRTTHDLQDLSQRPLFLRFITENIRKLEEWKLRGGSIDICKLYDLFVEDTLARDTGKEAIEHKLKRKLLEDLALTLHVEGNATLTHDKLDEWLFRCLEKPEFARLRWSLGEQRRERFAIFLQDMRNAALLVREGEDSYRFSHASLREYFLAEALFLRVVERRLQNMEVPAVGPEVSNFLLTRHRQDSGRSAFAENLAAQVAWREETPGVTAPRAAFRVFAISLILYARGELPWPDVADFSNLNWSNRTFARRYSPTAVELPRRAVWRRSNLQDVTFEACSFAGHDFGNARMSSSRWFDCDLSGADFSGADLRGAALLRCNADTAVKSANLSSSTSISGQGSLTDCGRPLPSHVNSIVGDNKLELPMGLIWLTAGSQPLLAVYVMSGIRIVDPLTGALLREIKCGGVVTSLAALSDGGRPVLAMGLSGTGSGILIFDALTGTLLRSIDISGSVESLAALSNGDRMQLAVGTGEGGVQIIDPLTAAPLLEIKCDHPVHQLASLAAGGKSLLAYVSYDNIVRIVDAQTGVLIQEIDTCGSARNDRWLDSLAMLHSEGRFLLAVGLGGDGVGVVKIFDSLTGTPLSEIEPGKWTYRLAALSDGVRSLLAVSGDGMGELGGVRIVDPLTGNVLRKIEGLGMVNGLASLTGGAQTLLAVNNGDGVRIVNPMNGALVRFMECRGSVTSLAVLFDGARELVACGGASRSVCIADALTWTLSREIPSDIWANDMAVLSDGRRPLLAFGGYGGVRIVDPLTGQLLREIESDGWARGLAVLHDGVRPLLAIGSTRKKLGDVQIFDPLSGTLERVIQEVGWTYSLAAVGESDRELLAVSSERGVAIIDPITGALRRKIKSRGTVVSMAALSDGVRQVLVTGGVGVQIFDPVTGALIREIESAGTVQCLAAVSNGCRQLLAIGSTNGGIRIVDPLTGALLREIETNGTVQKIVAAESSPQVFAASYNLISFNIVDAVKGHKIKTTIVDPVFNQAYVEAVHGETGIQVSRIGINASRAFRASVIEQDGTLAIRPLEDVVGLNRPA